MIFCKNVQILGIFGVILGIRCAKNGKDGLFIGLIFLFFGTVMRRLVFVGDFAVEIFAFRRCFGGV